MSKQKACCVGRLNGELKLHCHDATTWRFPSFSGKVACRGLDFHFWDAVDDLSRTDIDMVFDKQRLYMHNASGMFGSVPVTLSGELSWGHPIAGIQVHPFGAGLNLMSLNILQAYLLCLSAHFLSHPVV